MAPKKKDPNDWRYSAGKQLLLRDIRSGAIHAAMDWEEVYQYRPEFAVGPTPEEAKRLFKNRLQTAFSLVQNNSNRASAELQMLRQDRVAHPPPAFNHRGEPHWNGSAAQAFLKQDVTDKKHETMDRRAFYYSRPEYQLFKKTTISKHIDQEVRTRKFLEQYSARRAYF